MQEQEKTARFYALCKDVEKRIREAEGTESREAVVLERQRKAIIGHEAEVAFYIDRIEKILQELNMEAEWYPGWYVSLADGIFQELLGMAGVAEWVRGSRPELATSSSAKIIGDKIYFLIGGRQVLQPQTISKERRRQLRAALLIPDPHKRSSEKYHEVYLHDGTRVTLFSEGISKKDQECIVFRKFFVNEFTFEEQAARGTIPEDSIPLFKAMVRVGFNVAFVGAVRTAKTTFLSTWQSYENPALEGVMVETDPEIPLHRLMPGAPIMQLVPDELSFGDVVKNIMRSDADYIIVAEARDGVALNIAVRAANKGTRRVKMTYHSTDIIDFCYDVADEIVKKEGGDLGSQIIKVAKSFQYIFQFVQLPDKSKKRLKAIWEIRYTASKREISMHQICAYRYSSDSWAWAFTVGPDKETLGEEEDPVAFDIFKDQLRLLSERYPLKGDNSYTPPYNGLFR